MNKLTTILMIAVTTTFTAQTLWGGDEDTCGVIECTDHGTTPCESPACDGCDTYEAVSAGQPCYAFCLETDDQDENVGCVSVDDGPTGVATTTHWYYCTACACNTTRPDSSDGADHFTVVNESEAVVCDDLICEP
jgi:hypothetical protein